jgi:endonuclease/exonuclease/phosphatase (EEP) superfamily protein YafD
MIEGMVWAAVGLLVVLTVLPISRIAHGAVRSAGFARQQIIVLAAILLPVAVPVLGTGGSWPAVAALGAVIAVQLAYIGRFFPTGWVQTLRAEPSLASDRGRHVSLLTANVRQSNRDFDRLIGLIGREAPDVAILVETDDRWVAALEPLHADYPHRAVRAQDNGYGIAVLSRWPLEEVDWRDLVVEGVPSVRMQLSLAGEAIRLYVVHPEPPVPYNETEGRDAEIGLVGMEAETDPLPTIVAGDLNDVAWSHTTRRFQRLSGLLDPRVGRGFFNTFHAQVPIWRWPLDHLFHDPRFRLVEMRRLPDIGSDHFPMLFRLALAADERAGEVPGDANGQDRREIHEMAESERATSREPIGSDWEKE